MLVLAGLLLALMWSNHGMSTAVTALGIPNLQAAETKEVDEHRQAIHAEVRPSNGTSCGNEQSTDELLSRFAPCVPAVSRLASTKPTGECCSEMRSTGISCLCYLYAEYNSRLPEIVSSRKIAELPSKCNVSIPEGSTCDGVHSTTKPPHLSYAWFLFQLFNDQFYVFESVFH